MNHHNYISNNPKQFKTMFSDQIISIYHSIKNTNHQNVYEQF